MWVCAQTIVLFWAMATGSAGGVGGSVLQRRAWRQNGRARAYAYWVVAVGQHETGDTQTVDGPFALYYLGTVPQDSGPHRRTGNSNV